MKEIKILVPVAEGSEEMEAVIIIDMLRRAEFNVTVVADSYSVTCSRNVKIQPDILFNQLNPNSSFDAIILPGGLIGTQNLLNNKFLSDLLNNHKNSNKLIGAICAAPTIFANLGLLKQNDKITSHPSVRSHLSKYNYSEEKVVFTSNIITSRAAGTAIEFSLKIIEYFSGKDKAKEIANAIIFDYH